MAKFAFILPREQMLAPALNVAHELGMDVVFCKYVSTENIIACAEEAMAFNPDIMVARGRQASILREHISIPVVEIELTGQELALLLHQARGLVPDIQRPKIGVVTVANIIGGDIQCFNEVLGIDVSTYFFSGPNEIHDAFERAMSDNMDVILGGDLVNEYCRAHGKPTLFLQGRGDSIRTGLRNARNVGLAADLERKNTAHLQTLLAYSFNGIIELNPDGEVIQANDMAYKILGLEQNAVQGKRLSSFMSEESSLLLDETLRSGTEMYFSILSVNKVSVVANAAPIVAGNEPEGIVFSFYEMRTMERQGARALLERYRLYRYLAHGRFENIANTSREMQQVIRTARTFAVTRQPILLQGEVGSGKSLFAQSIHNESPCSKGPFVTFSCCAGWPDQAQSLCALIQEANGGTLYIDAVDQLCPAAQHELHRLLDQAVVQGRDEQMPISVCVRVVASLDKKLSQIVSSGSFRQDLYYMLASMLIELPPLRTRREDLNHAIDMCLDDCVTRLSRYVVLTKDARRVLTEYAWPGNYTQLKSFLDRMVLTAPSRTIHDGYVRQLLEQLYPPRTGEAEHAQTDELPHQAQRITEALARNNWSRSAVAAELGISKATLWRRMKQYGIYDTKLH